MATHNLQWLIQETNSNNSTMGNQAFCCSGKSPPIKRNNLLGKRPAVPGSSSNKENEAGMAPPFPALDVLRSDVRNVQQWLDETLAQLDTLEVPSSGRPPDEKKRRKNVTRIKELSKDFLKRSFETDELLSHSHAWLDEDNYTDTTFDLDIAKLEYSWSQVRDKLSSLASDYDCEDLQSDLAKDLSAQGGEGFSPTLHTSHIPRSKLISRRRRDPDGAQGHQPKHKRRFVPHLTWQYRAVIKSNVKYRDRTPRGSIQGSETSESGSVYSDPLFTVRRLKDSESTSSLSLPTVVGAGYRGGSSSSLSTSYSDADRHALFKPAYKGDPSSDSLVSRDLNSNTVRVKQRIKAIRSRQRREPSNKLSLVKYASDSSSDTKVIYIDLSSPTTTSKPSRLPAHVHTRLDLEDDSHIDSMEDWTKLKEAPPTDTDMMDSTQSTYPLKARFGKLTRSTGIHEGLKLLALPVGSNPGSGGSTPPHSTPPHSKSRYGRHFQPPDMSTPIHGDSTTPGVNRCPQTPVEIRRFLGTNNSGAGRFSPDEQMTPEFSDNSSNVSSLAHSPTPDSQSQLRKDLKRKYKKDELWRAIKSDYHYLMDEDIIEQCRSTDSDLSWDDEEVKNAVTFTDFIQQYNELMEWLNQIQVFTQRQGSSLSEKYLNQTYYEEMLDRSPRRKLFNDYAKQLMRRYPNMKDEITVRLSHLNNQWERLQKTIVPSDGLSDRDTMLRDLALDLRGLETWVNRIELTLQPRSIDSSLSLQQLQNMLKDHQVLQQDIECHSKVVSAVLKLCERLHNEEESSTSPSEELQITALNLERRWHSIWLQSLEWQCRLEDAVNNRTSLLGRSLGSTHTRRGLRDSIYDQSDSGLKQDSDDSDVGIQNDRSSQISETSNAQTVTHDRAPSPGTSTLGRPKKVQSELQSQSHAVEQPEVDSGHNYLELPDPDTHILVAEEDPTEEDNYQRAARPKQGLVRHCSENNSKTGAVLDRQYSTERKRRYSDSAHITVDSPDYSPTLRSKSLDDLNKLVRTVSSGSLSDDSDDLFDETEQLLKSVATELRTFESFDSNTEDDDEFFVYSKEAIDRPANSLLARYSSSEAALQSVLEEESEGSADMSSPRRLNHHSPGERVFASPQVKKFLQLQSFSNTISPSNSPPEGKRDSNLESDSQSWVEQGTLSIEDGKLVVDNNINLTKDINALPEDALNTLTATRLRSNIASSNNNGVTAGKPSTPQTERKLYRLEEFDARLEIVSSQRRAVFTGGDNEQQPAADNLVDYRYSDDDYYESSSSSSAYGGDKQLTSSGSLYLNRYANREDLSNILAGESPLSSDMEDLGPTSRLSLSPSDLRVPSDLGYNPPPVNQHENKPTNQPEVEQTLKVSADFGYVSGNALSELSTNQPTEGTNTVVVGITTPTRRRESSSKTKLVQLKVQPHSADDGVFPVTTRAEVEPCGPPRVPEQHPTLLVTLQSNLRDDLDVSSTDDLSTRGSTPTVTLACHSDTNATNSNTQPDSPHKSATPKLGPRSITVTGLPPSGDGVSSPRRKHRKLTTHSVNIPVKADVNSSPIFVSSVTSVIPKSSLNRSHTLDSPASLISKGGFTLKEHIIEKGTYRNKPIKSRNLTGSVILSPGEQSTLTPTDVEYKADDSGLLIQSSSKTYSNTVPQNGTFSILHGQVSGVGSLPHQHGSGDSSLNSYAIWETEVGLPANWSSVSIDENNYKGIVPPTSHRTSTTRSRSSSESYSTGYLTPTRSYLKVTSVETPTPEAEDFRETIFINPSEVTKTAQEVATTPTKSAGPEKHEEVGSIVKGIQQVTTTIKPATKSRRSLVTQSNTETDVSVGEISAPSSAEVNVSSVEISERLYQAKEFTTVTPSREPPQDATVEDNSSTPTEPESRYTSEANLLFKPGSQLAYNPDDVQGNTFHGKHRPMSRDEDEENIPAENIPVQSKASLVLARKLTGKPLSNQENTTPTKLEFTTSSIDNSGEGVDLDLQSRRDKAGTVYRILDNGEVVCESHPEVTGNLLNDDETSPDIETLSDGLSPSTNPDGLPPSISPDGLSPSTNPDGLSPSTNPNDMSPSTNPNDMSPSINPDGLSPSTNSDGLSPSTNPNDLSPSTNSDSLSPSTNLDGLPPSTNPDDPSPSTNPDGLLPSTNPDSLSPSTNPHGLPLSTNPDGLSPSTNPDGLLPSTNHDSLSPSTNPDGLSPSTNPDDLPSSTNPDGLPLSTNPDGLPLSASPDGLSPSTTPLASTADTSTQHNDLSQPPTNRALDLIHDLLPDEPESSIPTDFHSDIQITVSPPPTEHDSSPSSELESPSPWSTKDDPTVAADTTESYPEQSTEQKRKILEELDAVDDSTAAVSLFDLITSMSVPGDVQDIPPTEQASLPYTAPAIDISGSPRSDDSSHADVCDSPLEDYLSSGIEELPVSDEDENVFRPISGDSEYDSESYTHDSNMDTYQVGSFDPAMDNAETSLVPAESVTAVEFTPMERCVEQLVVPKVHKYHRREVVSHKQDTLVTEQLSPLASCHQFEVNGDGLDTCLADPVIAEDTLEPGQSPIAEESIVPLRKKIVERPTVMSEPSLDKVESDCRLSGYSDAEELSDVLEHTTEIEPELPKLAGQCNEPPLETSFVNQTLSILSHSGLDHHALQEPARDVQPLDDTIDGNTSLSSDENDSQPLVSDVPPSNLDVPCDDDTLQTPVINVIPSDSEACDGDESSEGEEDTQPRADIHWPSSVLDKQQLVTNPVSPSAVESTKESSSEAARNTLSSSTDHTVKSTPSKRRRKKRPRTLTGSPKPPVSESPALSASPAASPLPAYQHVDSESHDPISTNQESDDGSHDPAVTYNDDSDVISSDNDLANTARLSEGSNWDYYQDPPYSTETDPDLDVDLEPKLNDILHSWEDDESDNETLSLDVRPRESRLQTAAAGAAADSDSEDSDIEDLHYVIQQSSTQLLQADSALRKPRRAVVQSGIYLDPQKYIEWHATCQTNIKCLQVIQEHLESEQGLTNLTDDDIQQVINLIRKWQSLEKVALQRRDQSTTLCKIYRDILSGQKLVKLSDEQMSVPAFNDVGELESHFRSLQTFRVNLQSQSHKMQQISDASLVFESENKKIKMAGFKQLHSELTSSLKPTILNVGKKMTELQYALVQWHKWNSDCKELETSLVKTSLDIESMELSLCEQKLVELEASFSDYSAVCTAAAHNFTEEKISGLQLRLNHLMSDREPTAVGSGTVPLAILHSVVSNEELPDEARAGSPEGNWTDDNSTVVSNITPPPSLFLDVSPERAESLKSSSMESGFATMETERSAPEVEVSEGHSDLLPQTMERSGVDQQPPEDVDITTQPSAEEETSSVPAIPIGQPTTADLPSAMTPLVVDVNHSNDTGNSDHQTPPTVEDLAPTLPITDQEKIQVANRRKKNKRNKRKGKNKHQPVANHQSEPVNVTESANQVDDEDPLGQSGQSITESHEQSTSTDTVSTETVQLQTDTSYYADSGTNTDTNSHSQVQTELIPTVDQSTHSESQEMTSQCILTDNPLTSTATNQTEPLSSTEQSTETESWNNSAANQTDTIPHGPLFTSSTNTNFNQTSSSQTDHISDYTDSQVQTHLLMHAPLPVVEDENTQTTESDEAYNINTQTINDELPAEVDDYQAPPTPEVDDCQATPTPTPTPEIGLLPVDEEVIAEHVLRHRKPPGADMETTSDVSDPCEEVPAKSLSRGWLFTPRTLRYLGAIFGSLLFLFILLFLLEPRCCENTQYHKGIFGLRRQYTQFPPH